jgi:hypothetical protein
MFIFHNLAKFCTKKITLKQIDDYQQNNLAKFGYKAYVKFFLIFLKSYYILATSCRISMV